jgi:F-type H+-transporting ATPase subunit gamma
VETALRVVLERPGRRPAEPQASQRVLAVVFASDQGLCGTFNERAVRAAVDFKEKTPEPMDMVAVGRRAHDLLSMRGVTPVLSRPAPTSLEGIRSQVPEMAADVFDVYLQRGADRMVFVYNDYESMGRFREKVLPVLPPDLELMGAGEEERFRYEPVLTMPPADLLAVLIEEYFFIQFCRALYESHCSENGARLMAMTAASGNIDDRFTEVRKEFQLVRQDSITAELLDVVAGAEALRTEG